MDSRLYKILYLENIVGDLFYVRFSNSIKINDCRVIKQDSRLYKILYLENIVWDLFYDGFSNINKKYYIWRTFRGIVFMLGSPIL